MSARTKIAVTLFFTLLTLSLGLFLLTVEARGEPQPEEFLPKYMTPAESLRVDEIGKFHKATPPPDGWVETPGEFEELRGVWVTWITPSYNQVFGEIVRESGEVAKVYIIVANSSGETAVRNYLNTNSIPQDSVYFYYYPRNSIWVRDYGPWFMRQEGDSEGIVDFIYNRPRPQDDTISVQIGDDWGLPVYGSPLEHPGGNFMTDGLGTGFASDLIYDENPGYSAAEIDSMMLAYSGLDQFLVVQKINIEYTGHIDLWTKCLNDTLIMVGEYASGHPNYALLNQHAEYFKSLTNREGRQYRVVRMPMPDSDEDAPPSYLNSLIVNGKVLVPLWNEAEDDTALIIYQNAMPGHEIVGINCSSMASSGGAIHCITMQAPAAEFVHIKHAALGDTEELVDPYRVRARILTSGGFVADSTAVRYRTSGGPAFSATPLSAVIDTPGVYEGFIPAQSAGDTVEYYLQCLNADGVRRTSPWHAPSHLYSFRVGSTAPMPVAELSVELSADDLYLHWSPVTVDGYGNPITVDQYYVYRDTVASFEPGSQPFDSTVALFYMDDTGVTGDVGRNYYYAVTAVSGTKESALSGLCGEFDHQAENGE